MPNRNKSPTNTELLSAIRRKCMDCSGQMRNEVRNCLVKDCPLRPYRCNALDAEDQIELKKAVGG